MTLDFPTCKKVERRTPSSIFKTNNVVFYEDSTCCVLLGRKTEFRVRVCLSMRIWRPVSFFTTYFFQTMTRGTQQERQQRANRCQPSQTLSRQLWDRVIHQLRQRTTTRGCQQPAPSPSLPLIPSLRLPKLSWLNSTYSEIKWKRVQKHIPITEVSTILFFICSIFRLHTFLVSPEHARKETRNGIMCFRINYEMGKWPFILVYLRID